MPLSRLAQILLLAGVGALTASAFEVVSEKGAMSRLGAHVIVTEVDPLREELKRTRDARGELESSVEDLTKRLEASSTSNAALESQLAMAREETGDLRKRLALADESLGKLRGQCEMQKNENREVREANRHLEQTVNVLTARYETASNEVAALRKALSQIHAAATETTGRLHTRHHRPPEGEQA